MVHALQTLHEIARVLRPGGHLLDLRPYNSRPIVEIVGRRDTYSVGLLDDSPWHKDDTAADDAMASICSEGLFQELRHDNFRFALYWDHPDEMRAYIEDRWTNGENAIPPQVFEKAVQLFDISGGGTRVRVRLMMNITLYRKLNND